MLLAFEYEYPDYNPAAPVKDRVERVNMLVMDHMVQSCKRDGIKSAIAIVNGNVIGGVRFHDKD